MDVLPTGAQESLPLGDDAQGAADPAAAHRVGPDRFGSATGAVQVDLGLAVTENVDAGRLRMHGTAHRSAAIAISKSGRLRGEPHR